MSFLLFAFRKLSLKRQINQKNYQMTLVSNQRQSIQSQISVMEQAKGAAQDAWSTMSNQVAMSTNTVFQTSVDKSSQGVTDAADAYRTAKLNNDKAGMDTARGDLEAAQAQATKETNAAMEVQRAAQLGLVSANQLVNSVFTQMDNAKLAILQRQDQRLDTEQGQLESEAELLNGEYENVKKAESQAAKDCAPSFGMA